jgi:hypothetical protein
MASIVRGGCDFYIRSVRRGGRITSEYLGSGELAWLADARAQNLKAEREDRRRKLAARLARWDRITASVEAYVALIDHLFRLAMEAAGYHQHKRGEWRRRRMNANVQVPAESRAQTRAVLEALSTRVADGDRSALPTSRDAIDKALNLAPCEEARGFDPGRSAERAVIRWAAGKDPIVQEVIRHRLNRLRADLAGQETPTVLERLMIDQVALTWLEVNTWVETTTGVNRLSANDECMPFVEHLERRRGAAHQRFNRAVKALAMVRRLALPRLKVKPSVEDRSDRIPLAPGSSIA